MLRNSFIFQSVVISLLLHFSQPLLASGFIGDWQPSASWRFAASTNSPYSDASGKGHDLILGEPQWHDEGGWSALVFDGVDSWATVKAGEALQPQESFTFALWVKPARVSPMEFLFGRPNSKVGSDTPLPGMMLAHGRVAFGGVGKTERAVISAGDAISGVWTFLVGTWDGSTLRLYQDGAGWVVRPQQDRALFYQHFVLAALETPAIIGIHHYKYADDATDTRDLAALGGANKGLFDLQENPYTPIVEAARSVNAQKMRSWISSMRAPRPSLSAVLITQNEAEF